MKSAALLAAGLCLSTMVWAPPAAVAGNAGFGVPSRMQSRAGPRQHRQPQEQPAPQPAEPQTQDDSAPPPAAAAPPGEEEAGQPARLLTEEIPAVRGPKRTVAVGKFDAIGAFTSKYGSWDIGGGLAAMLTSALVESGRFIVLERANIQQILSEQELKAAGVTNPETGPQIKKLTGVQLLIYGALTEFGTDEEGGGFSVGLAGGALGSLLGGAVSRESASGTVAMDIRIVDSTTGGVLETHRVEEEISSTGWDLSVGYQGISLGTNEFYKTPLGDAVRRAITRAVQHIARDADGRAWTGLVVDYDGEEVYINAGSSSGLKTGDKFMIERVAKTLTDPATGEVLSVRRKELGLVEVTGVEEKLCYGSFLPLDPEPPQRGDIVVMAH